MKFNICEIHVLRNDTGENHAGVSDFLAFILYLLRQEEH